MEATELHNGAELNSIFHTVANLGNWDPGTLSLIWSVSGHMSRSPLDDCVHLS